MVGCSRIIAGLAVVTPFPLGFVGLVELVDGRGRDAKSKPIVLASDTDVSCSVVTNTTTLAHQGRRGGVHPITASTLLH
jgi:hypothetical protein